MGKPEAGEVARVAEEFALSGAFARAQRHGHGRIHETWLVACAGGRRYVLQRLNARVFRDLDAVMENVVRVSTHLDRVLARPGAPPLRPLRVVPTRSGESWLREPGGGWRAYEYVEGSRTLERAERPEQAYEAARAFGAFAALLADLPAPPLRETIPGFHDTAARVRALRSAAERDAVGRLSDVRPELERLLASEELAERIPRLVRSGGLSLRVVHNDTKLNNVLFDAASGRAACVIDLDTVMPGYLAFDFGDLVRSATNAAPEDGADLAQVAMRLPMFEALARGYVEGAGPVLDAADRESLVFAGPLLAFEVALRFLTDHLEGDVYFRVTRPGENLARARVQLALLASMQSQADAMARCLARA
jgi:hypothetical protein